jgi:hypothetical protein
MFDMRRWVFASVILMLMSTGQVMAETPEKTKPLRIGAGLGFAFAGYREETQLPLNRRINTLTYSIDGIVEKGNFFHSFNIGFFMGKVKAPEVNTQDDFYTMYQKEASFTRAYLQYALDYRLWGNKTFPGYLGGALRGDIYYNYMVQTVYFSFTGAIGLNLHATQKWIINEKNTLIFSVGFPLAGYARRPPYFGFGHDLTAYDDQFSSLHNYLAVFGDLKYHYTINSLFSLSSGLGFELSYFKFPQPRKDAQFRLNIGIAFNL